MGTSHYGLNLFTAGNFINASDMNSNFNTIDNVLGGGGSSPYNCRIMTGYYTGTGTTPEGAGITGLAARPKIGFLRRGYDAIDIGIFVWAYSSFCQGMVGLYGSGTSLYTTACQWYVCYADAYSTSFQTYQSSGDTRKNLNQSGTKYYYIFLL